MPTTKIKCPDCKTSRVITINKGRTVKCLKCDQHYYLELEAKTGFLSSESKELETTITPGPADIRPCIYCSGVSITMNSNKGSYIFSCVCGMAGGIARSIGDALLIWNNKNPAIKQGL